MIGSAARDAPAFPPHAFAHASDRGHVLLLPTGHYLLGGALAVAASFLVLLFVSPAGRWSGWPPARLRIGGRPGSAAAAAQPGFLRHVRGARRGGVLRQPRPAVQSAAADVWTLLWVGLTLVQGLFGNLWALDQPLVRAVAGRVGGFRQITVGRIAAAAARVARHVAGGSPLPRLRLVRADLSGAGRSGAPRLGSRPLLARSASSRCLSSATRPGARRGEFLSVFFGMVVALRHLRASRTGATLSLCLPGAKLADTPALPLSGTLFLLLALASVSFDGLSKTFFWLGLNGSIRSNFPAARR